jgi:LEA14-like dessication related protein
MNKRILTILLPFFVLMTVAGGCKKPVAFDYRDIRNFRLQSFSAEKARVSMELVYFNPNNYGVDLKNVKCDIFADSNFVGKFALDTLMHIPRNSEFSVPASFEVDLRSVWQNSINALFKEVRIGARGTTKVGKGGVYINVPINYEGMHKLNLF